MPNSYQPNDKSPASVQPVYVATCITHGFFQNLWRTIGDAIFVHIVTSSVYITSMEEAYCALSDHMTSCKIWPIDLNSEKH